MKTITVTSVLFIAGCSSIAFPDSYQEKIFLSGTTTENTSRLKKEATAFASTHNYTSWSIFKTEKAPWPLTANDYTIQYSR